MTLPAPHLAVLALALAATGAVAPAVAQTSAGVAGMAAQSAPAAVAAEADAQAEAELAPGPGQTAIDIQAEADEAIDFETLGARFTIGLGAAYEPEYFGSEDYTFGPSGTLRFDYIDLPGGITFGGVGAVGFVEGFGPRGSLRWIPERNASDHRELEGLDTIDATLEIGLGLGYEAANWRAFGDMRYGVIGTNAWVGELGADAIMRPRDDLVLNFGPRAEWGSNTFMDTYFGVSDAEEGRSQFDAYEASAGFYGVGVELGARYSLSPQWGVEGKAVYSRLINDAADSPIVDIGTQNQFDMQLLVTRSLSLGF